MAYRDVARTDFKKIEGIVKSSKPYRGTVNKYPLGERRYMDRHFYWYGDCADIYCGNWDNGKICRIYPDESIEFVRNRYAQSSNMMMTSMFWPYLSFSSKLNKGGDIVQVGPSGKSKEHLMFNGLRIFLKTGEAHPTTPYELSITSLDREKTKVVRAEHEEAIKIASTFFMVSTAEQIVEAWKQESSDEQDYFTRLCKMSLNNQLVINLYPYSFRQMDRLVQRIETHKKELLRKAKERLFQDLYVEKEAFKYYLIPAGSKIPSGNWGVRVIKHF